MFKFFKGLYISVNIIVIIGVLILHFFIKDATFKTSLWFYLMPLPVIILIILLLSVFLGKWRKYNIILAVFLFVIWIGKSFSYNCLEPINETDLEIVFWNASRKNNIEDALELHGGIPDILVLSESSDVHCDVLKMKYPNFYFYQSERELFVFSKTPLVIFEDNTSRFQTSVVHFETAKIQFYAVDVTGSPDVPRYLELNFVNNNITGNSKTILLGDFNLPYESLYFQKIKNHFIHFFSEKGNGFRETWPCSLPLLSLDHIWVSKDLKVLNSEKRNTVQSDHAMIKTVILH